MGSRTPIEPAAGVASRPEANMEPGIWPVIVILVVVVAYVAAKVVFYMRKSDRQWQHVDKSKLKEWQDDEEW